jgi:hypothetical protein
MNSMNMKIIPLVLVFVGLLIGTQYAQAINKAEYWNALGYAEGYSNMSMPHVPASFVQNYTGYKDAIRDRSHNISNGIDLGRIPAHTNDNYTDFMKGEDAGDAAYCDAQGHPSIPKRPSNNADSPRVGKTGYN